MMLAHARFTLRTARPSKTTVFLNASSDIIHLAVSSVKITNFLNLFDLFLSIAGIDAISTMNSFSGLSVVSLF